MAPASGREHLHGIALLSLAVLCFAILDGLAKYLSRYHTVPSLVWARYAVHTLLMLGLFGPRMGRGLIRTRRPWMQLLRALLLLGATLFFMSGLLYLPLAEATAINYLNPLLVTALSVPLLGERVSLHSGLAVLCGFVGVLIVVRPGSALFTPAILLPLAAAVCLSLYQIITRKFSGAENGTTTNFITGLVGAVLMSVLLPWTWSMPTPGHALLMMGLGIVGFCGHQLLIKAFEHTTPAVLAPFSYGQIVWAALLGYLVFDALPDIGSILGITVITASGLYVAYHHSTQPRRRSS